MQPSEHHGQRSIFIVDDDPTAIRLLREALHGQASVRFATHGLDALRRLRERPADLILLDGDMPGEDGFALCAKLKADLQLREIPVVFVTAHGGLAFETRALELGAADFITKPVSPVLVRLRVQLHLRLKEQLDELRRLSTTDGLTRLANRRAFDERLDQEWRRANRRGSPLALLLLDVDFFKQYNDAYGHARGDDCLRSVARVIAGAATRSDDLAARVGGEEFALVLGDTSREGALAVAEKVRVALHAEALPHQRSEVSSQITVSIGVAFTQPTFSAHEDHVLAPAHCLFEAADAALYQAKRGGRNRTELVELDAYDALAGEADEERGRDAWPAPALPSYGAPKP